MNSYDFSGTHNILWFVGPQDYVDTYHTTSLGATKKREISLRIALLKGKDIDRGKIDYPFLSHVRD
jgi:hypothetical protein